jgi:hypothetical protein
VLAKFGKFPFEHFAWGQALLYYNCVSTVTKDRILGKAWEAQLTMLVTGKKCWVGSVKKWLLKNQAQEVVGFLPPVQPPLETAPQPIAARVLQVKEPATAHVLQVEEPTIACALQARTVQLPLGTIPGTTHIHLTHLVGVKGWVESQVLWCNAHNIWVGVRMAELVALQLVQLVGARSTAKGPTNQEVGAPPPPGFPRTMLNVENMKDNISLKSSLPTARLRPTCRQDICASRYVIQKQKLLV